jgi:hypothetical protein
MMQENLMNFTVKEEPEENIIDEYHGIMDSELNFDSPSTITQKDARPRLPIEPRRLSNQEPAKLSVIMKTPPAKELPFKPASLPKPGLPKPFIKRIVQLPTTSISSEIATSSNHAQMGIKRIVQLPASTSTTSEVAAANKMQTKMLIIQRTNSLNVIEGVDGVKKLVNAKRQSLDLAKSIMNKCKKQIKVVTPEIDCLTPNGKILKTRKLRPWLDAEDMKTNEAMLVQCDREFLREIFKCMHPRCSMHTNEPEKFAGHLHLHEGPLKCCYCSFEGDATSLPVHIVQQHGNCKFACRYCFYRTVSSFCMESHMMQFHNGEKNNLKLQYQIAKFFPTTPEQAKEKRKLYVKPIRCPGKEKSIFVVKILMIFLIFSVNMQGNNL